MYKESIEMLKLLFFIKREERKREREQWGEGMKFHNVGASLHSFFIDSTTRTSVFDCVCNKKA